MYIARSMRIVHSERTASSGAIDFWFAALDGQRIDSGDGTWIIEVVGIHVDGADLWVQIAPHGHESSALVLRVSWGTPVDWAKVMIRARAHRCPAAGLQVIDVRQTRPAA